MAYNGYRSLQWKSGRLSCFCINDLFLCVDVSDDLLVDEDWRESDCKLND